MKSIGLTGGIGSGKSTVSRIFRIMGVPVYDSDSRAKRLMSKDADIQETIRSIFGKEAVEPGMEPNFRLIGKIAFEEPGKLEQLNRLVHPAVARDFDAWRKSRTEPLIVKEAAILLESGADRFLDGVIVVTAPEEMRIRRVMDRNGLSEQDVRRRIARQWPEEKLIAMATYRIRNDESTLVIPQVINLLNILKF